MEVLYWAERIEIQWLQKAIPESLKEMEVLNVKRKAKPIPELGQTLPKVAQNL